MPIVTTILLIFMIIGALIAVETPNLLSSIISLGLVGFMLSIAFLFLGAPDLAIAQIAVEVLSLIILIRATIKRDLKTISPRRGPLWLAFTMLILLGVSTYDMLKSFPEFGVAVMERVADAPSKNYLQNGLEETGAANIVTSIILDYRAYDTLGEATILFCSILGAITILRKKARK